MSPRIPKDRQFYKFCGYGFFKNLRFFDPFIMLFFREMGLSFFQIGLLFSIREISVNVLEIPSGVLADTFGRRRAMVISFSSYLVSFSLFYLFGYSFWFSAVGMVLYGSGDAFRSGTHKAMILEYLNLKGWSHLRVDYYGRTRSCSQLGSALAALIAAALVFYNGSYRIVFLASIGPYIIDLVLMLTYPRELDGARVQSRLTLRGFLAFTIESFRKIFQSAPLRRSILNTSLGTSSFKVSKDYLQPIVQTWAYSLPVLLAITDLQRSALLIGIVYFVIYMGTSRASRHAGDVQRKIGSSAGSLNVNYILNIGIYLVAGIGVFFDVRVLSLLAFLTIFLIQSLQKPVMVGFLSEVSDHQRMATTLSVEKQSQSLFIVMFAPIIGMLADQLSVGGALVGYSLILLILFPLARVRGNRK